MIGLPQVIGIEEGDPVAGRRPNADIAPCIAARSRRREIEQRDPRISGGGRQFAPAVGRAIIDHEYLMRGKALRERALDRRADMRRLVKERRSEEHTSELQSLMRISYAVFCLTTQTDDDITTLHTKTPN